MFLINNHSIFAIKGKQYSIVQCVIPSLKFEDLEIVHHKKVLSEMGHTRSDYKEENSIDTFKTIQQMQLGGSDEQKGML